MRYLSHLIVTTALLAGVTWWVSAQELTLSGAFRPRFEHRYGYGQLASPSQWPANWVSQRTRLIADYRSDAADARIVLQNVRVWGDVSTLSRSDRFIAFHEAWARVPLWRRLSLKVGRQEIVYDDHRIFGNVGWAQQARSHDAAVLTYRSADRKTRLDVGGALNANKEEKFRSYYPNTAGYKDMQYLWFHRDLNKVGVSVLALNVGREYPGTAADTFRIDNMQTLGGRVVYKDKGLSGGVAAYYQGGRQAGNAVKAFYYAGEVKYTKNGVTVGAGREFLSGKATNDSGSVVKSFAPLFGTNHKFNGWMDYFYVGTWMNSVGLEDIYGVLSVKKGKTAVTLMPHLFRAAADVYDGSQKLSRTLGTEIDLSVKYKLTPSAALVAGFSTMMATETMEVMKGGSKDEFNRWGWMMLVIRPRLGHWRFEGR